MENNLEILFLGGLFPKETEAKIISDSKKTIQNAANNLQWCFVSGLDENCSEPITILNSLFIGSFPKRYKKLYINTYSFEHTKHAQNDINVGFLNFTGIKKFSRYISLKPYIKKWAEKKTEKRKVIVAYAMTETFTKLMHYSKKIDKNIILCLIIPDLPKYMNTSYNESIIFKTLKDFEIKNMMNDLKYIDCYVLLTEHMHQALGIKSKYIVVEGISTNIFENIELVTNVDNLKCVLYSGGLFEKYGIIDLLNAFEKTSNINYRLIICGSGDSEDKVILSCKRDSRIIFKGLLPREDVLRLQKSATVLVNPRRNNEEFTKFSFPSKILEYMSSGRPMIAYKLDGIPDEYDQYFYKVKDNDNGLFETLEDVLEKQKNELDLKGELAKEFVLNKKNGKKQAAKIIQMINEIIENQE